MQSLVDVAAPSFDDKREARVSFAVPKAEMHVHISLALAVEVFMRRIKDGRTEIDPDFVLDKRRRYYRELVDFHTTYEGTRHVTNTGQELAQATQLYLERIAQEGAIYAEISNSFRDPDLYDAQIEAIAEGIECARANTGIEARIIVTSLRDAGHEHAEKAATHMARNPHPLVTGFGLVGDETKNGFVEFARSLAIAFHEGGLGLAPHVAEQLIHNAIDFIKALPVDPRDIKPDDHRRIRAGHATLIHMSSDLMREFAERSICIETCLSANKRIDVPKITLSQRIGDVVTSPAGHIVRLDRPLRSYFDNLAAHPMAEFIAAGIPVCQGSDNPLLMNTNIGKESSLGVKAGLVTKEEIPAITMNALMHGNLDPETRARLIAKVDHYRAEVAAGRTPTTTANGYRHAFRRA